MQQPASAGFQLSPQQKHLWNLQDGHAGAAQVAILLEGTLDVQLDVQLLKDALRALVSRHEILRTSFQRNTGMKFPFQVVAEDSDFVWNEVNLAASTLDDQVVDSLFAANQKFDASVTPNLCCTLATLGISRQVLVLSLPGLCADAASLSKIVFELRDQYAGEQSEVEPLQYADYSEWQNELLQSTDEEAIAGRDYWPQHDFSAVPKLRLPFVAKTINDQASLPISVPVPVDEDTIDRLSKVFADDLEEVFLSAWQVLASRLSGQDEIVVAEISDARNQEELSSVLGLVSKAVPRYANFESELSFADTVLETRRARSEATQYQNYLDPSAIALTVGFSTEDQTSPQPATGLSFSIIDQRCDADPMQLRLRCIMRGKSWNLELVYSSTHYSRDTVDRFARQLALLLRAVIGAPTIALSALTTMQEDERQHILVGFNQTSTEFPREKCVYQLFEEQAARTPDRAALQFGNTEFSYAELNARANRLAHLLRKHGVTSNTPVGLCLERSAGMIVGLLGILKAGGCYVPLVHDTPKTRLAHQLEETAAPVVITEAALLDRLPKFSGKIVCLDRDEVLLEAEPAANPAHSGSSEDLVYIIYTSGSTGTPKGVAVRHSNLLNYTHFIGRLLRLEKYPEGLQFATVSTISADLGNTCIFPSLVSGGCLHVIDQETAMAANLFASYTAAHPIDVLKITPSHLATLLSVSEGKATLPRSYLILGGEALSWDLVDRIRRVSDCTVINHYGPTETTVGCCTFTIKENDVSAWSPATVPIGRPIANDRVYILDRHMQPTSIGVPGEICIGGAGVASGYLNQPQQTAERFIPDPFSGNSTARLYRTGDLARFLPDGNVEFIGRIDQQVKIRGFRVEPAEIESVLRQHPSLREVAVVPYDDKSGDKRLAAYFVSPKAISTEELREFLGQKLPTYMVPSAFVSLASLPLTPNGKVDLRALPSPEENQTKAERLFLAPANPAEEQLAGIWREVLKIERISTDDNFFELGGHSLLATQIISRIRNGFRVQMPLHSFLETPTILGLAEKLSQCPPAESEEEEMARLLQELEGLSDEEAELLLAADLENNKTTDEKEKSNL